MNSPVNRDHSTNEKMDGRQLLNQMLWLLNYSDGTHKLTDISLKSGFRLKDFIPAIEALQQAQLLMGPHYERNEHI